MSAFSLPIRFSFVPARPASCEIASQFPWCVDVVVRPVPRFHPCFPATVRGPRDAFEAPLAAPVAVSTELARDLVLGLLQDDDVVYSIDADA